MAYGGCCMVVGVWWIAFVVERMSCSVWQLVLTCARCMVHSCGYVPEGEGFKPNNDSVCRFIVKAERNRN